MEIKFTDRISKTEKKKCSAKLHFEKSLLVTRHHKRMFTIEPTRLGLTWFIMLRSRSSITKYDVNEYV